MHEFPSLPYILTNFYRAKKDIQNAGILTPTTNKAEEWTLNQGLFIRMGSDLNMLGEVRGIQIIDRITDPTSYLFKPIGSWKDSFLKRYPTSYIVLEPTQLNNLTLLEILG